MIDKFWFKYGQRLVVIYAKSKTDAFNSWKRLQGGANFYQSDFEKVLIDDPNTFDFLYLVGDSLTREETLNIIYKKKIKNEPKIIISEPLTEVPQIEILDNMKSFFELM